MLQQALLLNVSNVFDESASIDERVIAAKLRNLSPIHMSNLWVALLESGWDLDGAERRIHIDWATDFKRGPGVVLPKQPSLSHRFLRPTISIATRTC